MNFFFKNKVLDFAFILSLFAILTYWGNSFSIHSSEYWSIYISKHFFDFEHFGSISIKPIFHLILSAFHLLPLNDIQHIMVVKFVFSVLGAVQVLLILRIVFKSLQFDFNNQKKVFFLAILIILSLLSNVIYLENFFRIRSDQLTLTLFLLILNYSIDRTVLNKQKVYYLIFNSLIAVKSVFFSLLFISLKGIFKKTDIKYFKWIALVSLAIIIWSINIFFSSLVYYYNSLNGYFNNLEYLKIWLKTDIFIFIAVAIQLSFVVIKKDLERYKYLKFYLIFIIYLLIVSQKYTFFLASLMPLLYYLFVCTLPKFKKNFIYVTGLLSITIVLHIYNWSELFNYKKFSLQINYIEVVSNFIKENKFTYIDSMGLLPRQKNLNCFLSPDDLISEENCRHQIRDQKADVIIYNQRMMSVIPPLYLENNGYVDIGFSVYVKKELGSASLSAKPIGPALLIFGFER